MNKLGVMENLMKVLLWVVLAVILIAAAVKIINSVIN